MKRIATFTVLIISALIAVFIVKSYRDTEQSNERIRYDIKKVEEELYSIPPPPPIHALKKEGSAPSKTVEDTSTLEYEKQKQIRIELIGILKLQINENNSWETILKLLVLILVSYGGIKYINRKFAS